MNEMYETSLKLYKQRKTPWKAFPVAIFSPQITYLAGGHFLQDFGRNASSDVTKS